MHGNELHLFMGQGIPPYTYYYVSDGLLDNRVTDTFIQCLMKTDTPSPPPPSICSFFFHPVPEALTLRPGAI